VNKTSASSRQRPIKLRALEESLTEAVTQARLAYQFNPSTYTHSALNACLSAGQEFSRRRRCNSLTTNRWLRRCPAASSAKERLRPEDQPRLSKATFPTRWKQKSGAEGAGGRWRQPQEKSGRV